MAFRLDLHKLNQQKEIGYMPLKISPKMSPASFDKSTGV